MAAQDYRWVSRNFAPVAGIGTRRSFETISTGYNGMVSSGSVSVFCRVNKKTGRRSLVRAKFFRFLQKTGGAPGAENPKSCPIFLFLTLAIMLQENK